MFTIKSECGCSIELHPIGGEIGYCWNPNCQEHHEAMSEKPYINMKIVSITPGQNADIMADVMMAEESDGTETFH